MRPARLGQRLQPSAAALALALALMLGAFSAAATGTPAGAAPDARSDAHREAAPPPAGPAVVRIHFQDRPPYSGLLADGRPAGLLVAPVQKALQAAGLKASWQLTPAQRQLALVQQGHGADCGLGWFRSAERAALGRFSHPIYRDRPFVALLRKEGANHQPVRLEALLADAARPLLVKSSYSYGAALDAALARAAVPVQTTTAEPLQMARMVAAGRAGWLLMAGEEAEHLLALPEFADGPLTSQALAGQPAGSTRHLYCNLVVSPDWLHRLDRALAAEPRP